MIDNISNLENLRGGISFLKKYPVIVSGATITPRLELEKKIIRLCPNEYGMFDVGLAGDEEVSEIALRAVLMVGCYLNELDSMPPNYRGVYPRLIEGQRFAVRLNDPSINRVVRALNPNNLDELIPRFTSANGTIILQRS